LKLMVTSVNPGAIAFYERLGFSRTGKTSVYPNDAAITEYEMMRALL
jgi:ribosomal protein S18 acetylase RimI-like enzyme